MQVVSPFVCLGVRCLFGSNYEKSTWENTDLHQAYTHMHRQVREACDLLLIKNIFCKHIDCCHILPDLTVIFKVFFDLYLICYTSYKVSCREGSNYCETIYFHTISDIIIIMQIRSDAFGTSGKSHLLTWLEVDSEQQQRIQTTKRLEHDSYSQRGSCGVEKRHQSCSPLSFIPRSQKLKTAHICSHAGQLTLAFIASP